MDEERRREARQIAEALARGWADPDALALWLAECAAPGASLLDGAVGRGVFDAERAARLRRSAAPTEVRPMDGPRVDPEPPTRSIRGRVQGPEPVLVPWPSAIADAPTEVRETDLTPDARLDAAPLELPDPVSLVTLPGEERFTALGPIASGRYELGPVVGRGGMGVVHAARDCALGRRVALKMLRSSPRDNPNHARALAREAQTTGQLDHPGIVPVYELRSEPDGTVFYTMKLVTGVSLAEVIRRLQAGHPETLREYRLTRRLQIFQQLCMAVHYAHNRGVLHRDLKPSNVLLGNYGEVLLVDWGIAQIIDVQDRLRDGSGFVEEVLDRPRLVGTPHYMSPEQASGNHSELDVRSDIFSLGVILHELVTLSLPLDETDTERYIARIRSGPLPPPSERARGRPPAAELERIIRRATAWDRRDRYADARALWEDIDAHIEGRQERDRRRQQAREAFLRGRMAAERFHTLSTRREALGDTIRAAEAALDPWSPRELKEEQTRLVFQRENLDLLLARAFSDATLELQRAIADDPEAVPPRQSLAALLHERFQAAEARRDVVAMTYFGDQIEQVGGATATDEQTGRVDVRTFPEGAEVSVLGVRDVEAAPESPQGRTLGRAPLAGLHLPPGIHVFVAQMDGYRDERYPLFVRPGCHERVLLALAPWSTAVPMVGREGELAQLRALFESTVDHRRARFSLLVGEPGSGRTRLQDAFADYIEARPDLVIFTWTHCLAIHQGVPWHATVEILRFRSGVRPGDSAAVVRERLREMTRDAWGSDESSPAGSSSAGSSSAGSSSAGPSSAGPSSAGPSSAESDAVADVLATLPGLCGDPWADDDGGAEARRARVEEALDAYLVQLGRRFPIVMIFKEMQWIDGASRRFLEQFIERNGIGGRHGGVPLFVLGSTTEALEDGRMRGRMLLPDQPRLRLPPLAAPAAAQLVASILKGRARDDVVLLINDRARGNPYLVQEFTNFLRERGLVRDIDGEWSLSETSTADLPQVAVSHFIAQRVRSLSAPEREALECAAVVGRVFWAEALSWLGVSDPKPLLAELARRDLVHFVPHARYPGTAEYAFRLETLWKVAYAGVTGDRRRALHARTADWLTARGGSSFGHRALLANHRGQAGEAAAAARIHAGLARDAAALAAWDEALHHWDRALAFPLGAAERAEWRAGRDAVVRRLAS